MNNKVFLAVDPQNISGILSKQKIHFDSRKILFYSNFISQVTKKRFHSTFSHHLKNLTLNKYHTSWRSEIVIKQRLKTTNRIDSLKIKFYENWNSGNCNSGLMKLGKIISSKMINKLNIMIPRNQPLHAFDATKILKTLARGNFKSLGIDAHVAPEFFSRLTRIKSLHCFKVKFSSLMKLQQKDFEKLHQLRNLKFCSLEFKDAQEYPGFTNWINEQKICSLAISNENLCRVLPIVEKCESVKELYIKFYTPFFDKNISHNNYSVEHIKLDTISLELENSKLFHLFLTSFKNLNAISLKIVFLKKSFSEWNLAFEELKKLKKINLEFLGLEKEHFEDFSKFCDLLSKKDLKEIYMFLNHKNSSSFLNMIQKRKSFIEKFIEKSIQINSLQNFFFNFYYTESITPTEIMSIIKNTVVKSLSVKLEKLDLSEYKSMLDQYSKLDAIIKKFKVRSIYGKDSIEKGRKEIEGLARKFDVPIPENFKKTGIKIFSDDENTFIGKLRMRLSNKDA